MTKDDILSLAREAGFVTGLRDYADGSGSMPYVQAIGTSTLLPELERFAALVAEKEREACALTCETPPQDGWHPYGEVYEENISKKLASAIRARGNK